MMLHLVMLAAMTMVSGETMPTAVGEPGSSSGNGDNSNNPPFPFPTSGRSHYDYGYTGE